MPTIWIPSLMRDLTGGRQRVEVPGGTVGEALAALDAAHPGTRARLYEGERLNPALAVLVDGRAARRGLHEPLEETSEVRFIPAVAGG